ncbi:MAG: pyrroloquinoline-quinone synthase PqqC [Gemmatimonadaceae bacterium]|nr:pyrroloquinoline-quinone synthase PqqC [Gemmatimonadaceae bacterium]
MSTSLLSAPTIAAPPAPPIPALDRPLAPDALVAALRGFHGSYYVEHPFHHLMHDGKLTQRQMQGWVANRLAYQRAIPRKDGAIISNCPLPEVRRKWIQRIIDHDGLKEREGGIGKWIQLGVAFGVPREEMEDERHVLPGVRFAAEMYVTFCKTKPWVEAAASSLTELFAPDIMRRRLESLPKYYPWIRADAYDYFNSRLTQAPRDSTHGLEIVTTYCTTVETQQRAFEALAFKIEMLWVMIDTIYNAYREE